MAEFAKLPPLSSPTAAASAAVLKRESSSGDLAPDGRDRDHFALLERNASRPRPPLVCYINYAHVGCLPRFRLAQVLVVRPVPGEQSALKNGTSTCHPCAFL
jgi:hypothetical protein